MCRIPCLGITSSKIWKSTSRCRHQKGRWIGLTGFPLFDRKPQPKKNVTLKIDFENAFNSMSWQFTLEKVFELHPEVYKYSHSAYSQSSFLFYGDSVIKICEGTQQADPESPVLFSDSIQDLIDSLESKINLWHLDDGNLSDDYRTVLKDLEKKLKRRERWDSKLNPRNVIFSPVTSLKNDDRQFYHLSKNFAPGSKVQRKMNLSFLGHRSARNHKQTYWERKLMNWKNLTGLLKH